MQDLSSRQISSSADCNGWSQSKLQIISRAQTPPCRIFFTVAAPRRSLKVGALLSDYRLRPFSFSRGLHAGILLLDFIYSLIITPSLAGRKKICGQLLGSLVAYSLGVLHQGAKFRNAIIRPALREESVLDLDRYHVTLRPLFNQTCSQQTNSWPMRCTKITA